MNANRPVGRLVPGDGWWFWCLIICKPSCGTACTLDLLTGWNVSFNKKFSSLRQLVAGTTTSPDVICATQPNVPLYIQSLLTLWINARSVPTFVKPSANISLVSTKYKLRMIHCSNWSLTDTKCCLKLHRAGSHTSVAGNRVLPERRRSKLMVGTTDHVPTYLLTPLGFCYLHNIPDATLLAIAPFALHCPLVR